MRDILIVVLIAVVLSAVILAIQINSKHNKDIQAACEIARENARKGVAMTLPEICF